MVHPIRPPSAYQRAAASGVDWLLRLLREDGSLRVEPDDLACYYKAPYLLALAGRVLEANRLLDYVQRRFMRADGDFTTDAEHKSGNGAFEEYWAYPNAWLALGSRRLGRLDVTHRAQEYLRRYDAPGGGFHTRRRTGAGDDDVADMLTSAHLGLLALGSGDVPRARTAGDYLGRVLDEQPDLDRGLLLRTGAGVHLIDDFAPESAVFHIVDRVAPDQAYFMIGYPIAFLAKLAELTGDSTYRRQARGYLAFALSCEGNLRASLAAHKVAWGAAVFGRYADEPAATALAAQIADFLVEAQDDDGAWLADEPAHTAVDQTAEIAIWLQEIDVELSRATPT